jgi:phosphatidylglycerol:prolipoprotein diacylglycerol transferase
MYPTISLGSLSISTYGLMRAAAVVVLIVGLKKRLHRVEWSFSIYDVVDVAFYLVIAALAGAWLAAFLPKAVAYLRGVPLPPRWWRPGFHWLGTLGGSSLAGYIYFRCRNLSPGKAFDLFAPVAPLALAVIRVGCLLTGCCYGRETTAWPSLVLPDIRGVWARRYPTRIASIIANLLIFVVLLAFERYAVKRRSKPVGWPFDGFLFALYVELYCVQRFYFEFWRAGMPRLMGPFTWTHLYCVIGIGLATWGIVRGLRRTRGPLADTHPFTVEEVTDG